MRFGDLVIQNFLSISNAVVNLSDRGLVLIEGKNIDDPSAKSNGSGKSSLVDALCFCLYGKTARGLCGDDVINRSAKKNCMVSVQAIDGEDKYLIRRYRKSSEGSGIEVFKIGCADPLTKGTMAETQELVEQIVGCPYEVFVAAVYAGQEAMPDLPSMTDKQLKGLIESVIGIERLTAAYQVAMSKSAEASRACNAQEAYIDHQKDLLNYRKEELDVFVRREEDRKERIKQAEDQLKAAEDNLKNCKELASSKNKQFDEEEKTCRAKIDELMSRLDALSEVKDKAFFLEGEARKALSRLNFAYSELSAAKRQAKDLVTKAKQIEAKIGTKCGECGKVYTAEDMDEARAIAVKNAKEAVEAAKLKGEVHAAAETAYDEAQAKVEELSKDMDSIGELHNQIREQEKILHGIESKRKDIANSVRIAEVRVESCKTEEQPSFKEAIDESREKVEFFEKHIADKKKELEELQKTKVVMDELIKVFGTGGVRAHILDTITPVLNDCTARYLDILSDGKLKAVWTTLSTTKKGEIREKFNIEVESTVGGGQFKSLSGGEKRKVRVACCLALQEVVASRATKPIELFIADEVDHALDEAGVERLISLLNEKAETCGSLFVISHNPLRNWIDNVITVRKENGKSTIE